MSSSVPSASCSKASPAAVLRSSRTSRSPDSHSGMSSPLAGFEIVALDSRTAAAPSASATTSMPRAAFPTAPRSGFPKEQLQRRLDRTRLRTVQCQQRTWRWRRLAVRRRRREDKQVRQEAKEFPQCRRTARTPPRPRGFPPRPVPRGSCSAPAPRNVPGRYGPTLRTRSVSSAAAVAQRSPVSTSRKRCSTNCSAKASGARPAVVARASSEISRPPLSSASN